MMFKSIRNNTKSPSPFLKKHFDDFNFAKDSLIVDLGCGNGRNIKYLESKGFKVIGFDRAEDAPNKINLGRDELPVENCEVILCNFVMCFLNSNERRVIDEVNLLIKNGEDLNLSSVKKSNCPLYKASRRYFGSWENVFIFLEIDYSDIKLFEDWTKEKVLDEIKKISPDLLYYSAIQKSNAHLCKAAIRYFGSWAEAVNSAGINYLKDCRLTEKWNKELIAKKLLEIYKANPKFTSIDLRKNNVALSGALNREFGNLERACEYAGFKYNYITTYGKICFDEEGNLCRSLFEREISNILIDYVNKQLIKSVKRNAKICKNRNWTCDFLIEFNGCKDNLWLEFDGLYNERVPPYGAGHPKINYYIENNFNFKIITKINQIDEIFK